MEVIESIKKGITIIESCFDNCKLQIDVGVFRPELPVMDILLSKDFFKIRFNGEELSSKILIFHNSDDKYSHNASVCFTCHLSLVPEVYKYVMKHKKVKALIRKMKKDLEGDI